MTKPRELLSELMSRSGHNPTSLSRALGNKVKQPQIYKFVEGITEEPKRSTLTPIADYYGISMEAFFDETLADALLRAIADGSFVVQRHKAAPRTAARQVGAASGTSFAPPFAAVEQALRLLADQIDLMGDAAQRQLIAQRLQTLALAPDSPKARQGVLEALQAPAQPRPAPPDPTAPHQAPGIAGEVLKKQLSTESHEVFQQRVKP